MKMEPWSIWISFLWPTYCLRIIPYFKRNSRSILTLPGSWNPQLEPKAKESSWWINWNSWISGKILPSCHSSSNNSRKPMLSLGILIHLCWLEIRSLTLEFTFWLLLLGPSKYGCLQKASHVFVMRNTLQISQIQTI